MYILYSLSSDIKIFLSETQYSSNILNPTQYSGEQYQYSTMWTIGLVQILQHNIIFGTTEYNPLKT